MMLAGMCGGVVMGQPYYISELNGSDATGDGSLGNPWKTFQHVQTLLNGGVGNTTFFFERGGRYPGKLTVDAPGNDGLTFAAYGAGARPVFYGDVSVPNLQIEGGGAPANRYISTGFGFVPGFVYENGVLLHHARYPDTG